jgi:hypothetical protein
VTFKLSATAVLATACVGIDPSTSATPEWKGWFSEYVLVATDEPTQALFTTIPNGIIVSGLSASLKTRLNMDTGRSIRVKRKGDAYWVEELPIFKPSLETGASKSDEHTCTSTRVTGGYEISCRNVNTGVAVRSFYREGFGVEWFEYYCGRDFRPCRYQFRTGSPLLGPRMIAVLGTEPT